MSTKSTIIHCTLNILICLLFYFFNKSNDLLFIFKAHDNNNDKALQKILDINFYPKKSDIIITASSDCTIRFHNLEKKSTSKHAIMSNPKSADKKIYEGFTRAV